MTGAGGHFDEQLQDFLDGRLTPTAAEEIQSHLKGCNLCRFQFDTLQKAKQAAVVAAEIPVPADLRNKIIKSLGQEDKGRRK
jgi:anti-sigma factor RsiW